MSEEQTKEFKVKKRQFSDKLERIGKTNILMLACMTIMEIIILLGLVVQINLPDENKYGHLGYIPIVILIISVILNWICYIRNRNSLNLKYIMIIGYGICYCWIALTGSNPFVVTYIYPILVASIVYFDIKYESIVCGTVGSINILRYIIIVVTKGSDPNSFTGMIISLLFVFAAYEVTKLAMQYDHDSRHTVIDEKKMQKIMIDDILKSAGVVRTGAIEAGKIVDKLQQSSEIVYTSLKEISLSTQTTAENIQEQTIMTQNIHEAIQGTVDLSRDMVDLASSSSKVIEDSMQVMDSMKEQAEYISTTNKDVADSMNKLQSKTHEVQDIVSMIFNISNQTNLLALNASIESARAGEAGRGFAVVADQIRQLAEQTRKSTEDIEKIINELNENAKSATKIVGNSIEAVQHQNQLIIDASESFANVSKNVDALTSNIKNVDNKVDSLVEANDTIVQSISQLSATSEEVTASTQAATEYSEENSEEAEKAKELLHEVLDTVSKLDKYLDK